MRKRSLSLYCLMAVVLAARADAGKITVKLADPNVPNGQGNVSLFLGKTVFLDGEPKIQHEDKDLFGS